MASGTSNKCANCGSDAAIRCDNCLDAPEYQLGDSGSTAYCNQACLRAHWPTHKLRCQVLERRKKLLRAATVLRTAFLTYREFAHDLDLDKIELRKISPHDEILYLHLRTGPIRARAQRDIFGWHLIIDARIRGAALAYNSFAIAPCLLGGLIEKLLDGIPSTIFLQVIRFHMPALVVELVPNPISTREEHEQHMVLMVKYLIANDGSNEEWILDVVGCRYGFQDLLIPSWRYMHNNARQLVNQCSYNGTEMRDLDLIYRDQSGVQSQAWQETLAFERRARGFFAAFVDKWASKDILNGSDGEFEEQTDEFVRVLKVCVLPVVI